MLVSDVVKCWLNIILKTHFSADIVSAAAEMTCDMSSETLNLTVPHHLAAQSASEEERRGSQGTDPGELFYCYR